METEELFVRVGRIEAADAVFVLARFAVGEI